MLKVRKGNKVKRIDERFKKRYIADGYAVIDEKGKVIESKKKTLEEENSALKKEVASLKKQLKQKESKEPKESK